jgi:hypothetical protein
VSHAGLVAWLAVRELWMTFRLVVVLAAFVGASAIVVLVPAAPAVTLDRMALGLAVATVITSSVAAWTLAAERTTGRSGWLITRSVSRGTYLFGWFLGLSLVAMAGVIGAGLLGWLATISFTSRLDPLTFSATVAAFAATAAAAIALGLAIGAALRALPAAIAAAAACTAVGVAILAASGGSASWPGTAYLLLRDIVGSGAHPAEAVRAAGVGLLLTAALLVVARATMERAEL